MAVRPIQEQFGDRVIETFADFARADLASVAELEKNEFPHVTNPGFRGGCRRSSMAPGGSTNSALLCSPAMKSERLTFEGRLWITPRSSKVSSLTASLMWWRRGTRRAFDTNGPTRTRSNDCCAGIPETLRSRSTTSHSGGWCGSRMSSRSSDAGLESELQWLRDQRNTIHLRQRSSLGKTAFLNQSKRAFVPAMARVRQTKGWKASQSHGRSDVFEGYWSICWYIGRRARTSRQPKQHACAGYVMRLSPSHESVRSAPRGAPGQARRLVALGVPASPHVPLGGRGGELGRPAPRAHPSAPRSGSQGVR